MKLNRFFLGILLGSLISSPVYSMGRGRMVSFESDSHTPNWSTNHPQVVIALGYLADPTVQRYSQFSKAYFEKHFHRIDPSIQIRVIEKAKGQDVFNVLSNRDTIGLIFVSHTYETKTTQSAIALTADHFPLPQDILSSATPALRFVSFLGCHGPDILRQYEVKYHFDRLPGHHFFFYGLDQFLSANFLHVDNLKSILKKEMKFLEKIPAQFFNQGVSPTVVGQGKLTIRAKDIYPYLEPRYVYVNGKMVGLLGSDPEHSNRDLKYSEFTFTVPALALEAQRGGRHRIKIISSEITPGAPADNYLIDSIVLEGPFGKVEKSYQPPLHFGDADTPPWVTDFRLEFQGTEKEKQEQFISALRTFYRNVEWMDRNPEIWAASPLKGRFFIDDLYPVQPGLQPSAQPNTSVILN